MEDICECRCTLHMWLDKQTLNETSAIHHSRTPLQFLRRQSTSIRVRAMPFAIQMTGSPAYGNFDRKVWKRYPAGDPADSQ